MFSFTPLTRQLLADDEALVVWLLTIGSNRYTSFTERFEIGDLVHIPVRFFRISPPATKNIVGGVQPYAEISVHDGDRTLHGLTGNGTLSVVMVNGKDISQVIRLASGEIDSRKWVNGRYSFRILNGINLSRSRPVELSDNYQSRVDPSDTAFDDQRFPLGSWQE